MSEVDASRASPSRIAVFGVLALVLAIRLAQLSSAMLSPLTYQPGPDEDYYRRFGEAVAAGQGQNSPEFTFMDPAYGYILGGIFRLVGVNVFVVFLLQVLLDTATAYGILTAGRVLGRPRAGLAGALLYGLTSTAVMFCTSFLKEVWVSAYLTWWVVGALLLVRSERKWHWLLFGCYCGLGVGLRSTLLVLGFVAVLLPALRRWLRHDAAPASRESPARWAALAALTVAGVLVGLLPWSLRNSHAGNGVSPLPNNGGIVLHQLYNEHNPGGGMAIPEFVSYLHPSEIWRAYAAEADRRAGRTLAPTEVDRYWHDEASRFIQQHPSQVAGDLLRKGVGWLSAAEVDSNRSDVEERMFSPVMAWLPPPTAWLLAMGLAGLVWLALQDRRWLIVALPVVLAWLTMAIFFAESRFRFHAASMLALCSGVWIEQLVQHYRAAGRRQAAAFLGLAVAIGAVSVLLGWHAPPAPVAWDRIAWGYIKMGRLAQAGEVTRRVAREQPNNGPILEALGYTAFAGHQYDEAAEALRHAIELRPRSHVAHYDLARVYLALGDREHAASEAKAAVTLSPSPEYQALLSQIESGS